MSEQPHGLPKINLRERLGVTPEDEQEISRYRSEFEIAQQVYDLRAAAGLTQKQLADLIGTSQSAIARLEDADYGGHSMAMLRRIAHALGKRVEVRFVDTVSCEPV